MKINKIMIVILIFIILPIVNAQVTPPTIIPQNPVITANGLINGEQTGKSIEFIGDINNDGFQEFAVGAPGAISQNTLGHVYIYNGKTGNVIHTFNGLNNAGLFGSLIVNLGDVNGNGMPDLAISEPNVNGGVIYIYDYSGVLLWSLNGTAQFPIGNAMASCDITNNGINDLIVGTPTIAINQQLIGGGVFMYDGSNGVLINQISPGITNSFGYSLDCMGDLNNDGIKELIVGAPNGISSGNPSTIGSAYIFSADGTLRASMDSNGINHMFGTVVKNIGDYDGDGINDLAVSDAGIVNPTISTGAVTIFTGTSSGIFFQQIVRFLPVWPMPALPSGANFGSSIAGGDVNGDGLSDIIIGAPGANVVSVFQAPGTSNLYTWTNQNNLFGQFVTSGDLNSDGFSDILIGNPTGNGNTGNVFGYSIGGVWPWGAGQLNFKWLPNQQTPQNGIATITGATPNSQGYLISGTLPASIQISAGNTILVDPNSANNFIMYPFTFNSNGQITFPNISLSNPSYAATNFYYQVIQLIPGQPANQLASYRTSNGLQATMVQ